MPHKRLLVQSAAREKVLHGALALADAVRVTLGPKSKCVLIEKKWGRPLVCNDGVTIAKEFELQDHEENLGAQVIRQAAERTGDVVGDGTTTSTLLAAAIFAEGVRNIAAGASAIDLKRGLDRALLGGRRAAERVVAPRCRPQAAGAGRDDLGSQRYEHRRDRRRRARKGRRGGHDIGRGSQGDRDDGGGGRGHAASTAATCRRISLPTPRR